MKQKILAVACTVCFLLSIACTLSGCYARSNVGITDAKINDNGELLSATVNDQTTQITRQYHVIDMMLSVRVGDTVSFVILRDGQETTVGITITADCLSAY